MTKAPYKILDTIFCCQDIKALSYQDLHKLCDEVRTFMIETVAKTGGHLGAGLGVVELTVALHKVFSMPKDKIVWDVGHQAYPHKILTGRKDVLHTIRQGAGLSGFTKRAESEYDSFGAGHSSTSISAALGMAVGRDLRNRKNAVVAVIGDGAMSAGLAFEGLNNAGHTKSKMIIILNDNDISIDPSVGAFSGYLSNLISSPSWLKARNIAKNFTHKLPNTVTKLAARFEEHAKGMVMGGTFFEELGFYYVGPVDGHCLHHLLPVLENVRDMEEERPVLIHVVTQKGKGYTYAEQSSNKYHGVRKFCVETGKQQKSSGGVVSYTEVFARSLTQHAQGDENIVAITAAMPSGTGVNTFGKHYPQRTFDVAIAEQHAVTFAAGLACEGMKPFVAIYSTFLQRAYDQIIHDVCVQNLPVRFAVDRAGLVGADGATHAGMFDIAYFSIVPNMVVMAPANEAELSQMIATAVAYDDGPIAFRYPRGEATGVDWQPIMKPLEIGRGCIVQSGDNVTLLSYGTRLQEVVKAAGILQKEHNITPTVVDARFAKPLDTALLVSLFKNHRSIVTIEEGVVGGFGSMVLHMACERDLLRKVKIRTLTLPDIFQEHDLPKQQYIQAGLHAENIVNVVVGLESSYT